MLGRSMNRKSLELMESCKLYQGLKKPIVAVIGRGSYPDERFENATGHLLRWVSSPLMLRPGEVSRVLGTASIDASQW